MLLSVVQSLNFRPKVIKLTKRLKCDHIKRLITKTSDYIKRLLLYMYVI